MPAVLSLLDRTGAALDSWSSAESRAVGLGRSLIATAQLSLLLLTPYDAMFVPVGPWEARVGCGRGLGQLSAFCWSTPQWAMTGLTLALLVVASGLLPRYTSWLHLYVSLSIGTVIDLPEGGDQVAMVACLFIALATLSDHRTWHWQAPTGASTDSLLRAVAWAGAWGLRLQMAYVYVNSGLAKLAVEAWQDGSATYYVVRMEFFGPSGVVADIAHWLTSIPVIALASSWGTIALEVSLAVLLLRGAAHQRLALMGAVALHLSIMVVLGLFSFGLVMIGGVVAATAGGVEGWRPSSRRTAHETHASTDDAVTA